MKRITKKFLENNTETLKIELASLKGLKLHLIKSDRRTKQNRYSSKINTLDNQISKIQDELNRRNEIKQSFYLILNNIISETKKIIDQSGIDKKAVQQQRDKYFDIIDEIAEKVIFDTVDFIELIGLFDMKILNYIIR